MNISQRNFLKWHEITMMKRTGRDWLDKYKPEKIEN